MIRTCRILQSKWYVDKELLSSIVKPEADYYVCSPVPFMKAIITYLKELGGRYG